MLGYLSLHWHAIAWALGVYAAVATLLVRRIPMPAAPPWKRALHKLLLDGPAALPAIDMKGMFGLPFNIPYVTLSKAADEPAAPIGKAAGILLPLLLAGALVPGCATTGTAANATAGQKLQADFAALQTIAKDVEVQCGPQYRPLGPVIASALMSAATAPEAISLIMEIVQAAPVLYADTQALICAIKAVTADLKAMHAPAAPVPVSAPVTTPPGAPPQTTGAPIGSPAHGALIGEQILKAHARLEGPAALRQLAATLDDPVLPSSPWGQCHMRGDALECDVPMEALSR